MRLYEQVYWTDLTWAQVKQLFAIPLPSLIVEPDVEAKINWELMFTCPVAMSESRVHRQGMRRLWDPHVSSELDQTERQWHHVRNIIDFIPTEDQPAVDAAIEFYYAERVKKLKHELSEDDSEDGEENEVSSTIPFRQRVTAYAQNDTDAESIDVLRAVPLDPECSLGLTLVDVTADMCGRLEALYPTLSDIFLSFNVKLSFPEECDPKEKKFWGDFTFILSNQAIPEELVHLHPAIEQAWRRYSEQSGRDQSRKCDLGARLRAAVIQFKAQTAKIVPCDN